jgi:hypothetical protein
VSSGSPAGIVCVVTVGDDADNTAAGVASV